VRAVDLRYLERWAATRCEPALRQMGADEIYRGKNDKFLNHSEQSGDWRAFVVLQERKKETLDEFFGTRLRSVRRRRIEACCLEMGEPFQLSIEVWVSACRILAVRVSLRQECP
jgi:hypothetical protein